MATVYEVTALMLNLRAAPDRHSAVLALMPRGQEALGTGEPRDGWVPLAFRGRSGFAAASHLRARGGTSAVLPPAPPPPAPGALINVEAKERDLAPLHPRFRRALGGLLEALEARALPFRVFEAWRQPERQAWLFASGRSRPGSIVTKAEPWKSFHQFGLAADLVLYGPQGWSWDDGGAQAAAWRDMQALAVAAGLRTLSFERPHVELDVKLSDWQDGSLLASGDPVWRAQLARSAERWRSAGGTGAPVVPPDDGERPPLPPDGQATT